jgi:DNA-binding transcriptional LysR family regulator
MLDWNDLRLALALSDTGSLSRGAKKLGMHQTTAGRRLDALEQSLAVPLFVRTTRGLTITPSGKRLVELVRGVSDGLDRLDRDKLEDPSSERGIVRIGTTETTALHILEHAMPELTRDLPDIVLELVTGNQPTDVLRGEVDLAVRLVKPEGAELVARRLGVLAYGLYASARYKKRHAHHPFAKPFANHEVCMPCLELERSPEGTWLRTEAANARVAVRSNSMVGLARAGELGHGLVVLPRTLAMGYPKLEQIERIPHLVGRSVYLLGRREDEGLARIRKTADIIARALRAYISLQA